MNPPLVDPLAFEALQAHAGADFVLALVEAFAEEAPRLLTQLREAAAQADAERFETLAHSLKSNGISFGALRLAALAKQLEAQGLAAGQPAIEQLAEVLAQTLPALRALARF